MPWLVAILGLLGYEWWALATGHTPLTDMVLRASRAWPLLPFLAGLVVGGLAVHFWWRQDGATVWRQRLLHDAQLWAVLIVTALAVAVWWLLGAP